MTNDIKNVNNIDRVLLGIQVQLLGGFHPIFNLLITQEPTQIPKTPKGEDFLNHEILQIHEISQMPQIHFQGSQ